MGVVAELEKLLRMDAINRPAEVTYTYLLVLFASTVFRFCIVLLERFRLTLAPHVNIATVGEATPRIKQFVKFARPADVKARLTVGPAPSKLLLFAEEKEPPVTLNARAVVPRWVKSLSLISNNNPPLTLTILFVELAGKDILQLFITSCVVALLASPFVPANDIRGTLIATGEV
jgi:hypothetical protein